MDTDRLIHLLEQFAVVLPAVVSGVTAADARWRPAEGRWSILEIVTHLADEEIEDFRTRVKMTLDDRTAEWPPIDPEGVAVTRRYNDGDLATVTDRFVTARLESVAWLRSLRDVEWQAAHEHPRGALRAGDIFASWVAHDALHLRQLAKRRFELTQRDAAPFDTGYAGAWTA